MSTKFNFGDRVFVIGNDLKKIQYRLGNIINVFEQEPTASNFYTVRVELGGRFDNYTVFENELRSAV